MAELFDSEFLARLEYLALVAKRIVRGELRADRITKKRGAGVEFADFREYIPGDDFRYIDWNAYARLGQLLLKMYEEEQDLHVYFLLDTSHSMDTGDPSKLRYGKQLVAALAYIALSNLDRAGISMFAGELVGEIPVARGKSRIMSMLQFLEDANSTGEDTNLVHSIDAFLHRARRRGVIRAGFEPDSIACVSVVTSLTLFNSSLRRIVNRECSGIWTWSTWKAAR